MAKTNPKRRTLPPGCSVMPSGNVRLTMMVDGRRINRTMPADSTRAELELARAQMRTEAGATRAPVERRRVVTLRSLIDEVHDEWTGGPNTLADRRRILAQFPEDLLGRRVDRITAPDVDALYGRLRAQGLSAHRISRAADVIGTALDRAARLGHVPTNVARNVPRPAIERREIDPPDDEALVAILDSLTFGWLAVGVELLMITGARRGEVAGLRWDAIDLDGAELSIERAIIDTDAGVRVKDTKTNRKGRRRLFIDPDTVTLLRRWHAHLAAAALARGVPMTPWVFPDRDGISPRRADSFTQGWTKHLAAAGLPHVRLHDLRHAVATKLLAAGMAPSIVSKRLGHSGVQITQDLYGHMTPAADQAASSFIAKSLRRQG